MFPINLLEGIAMNEGNLEHERFLIAFGRFEDAFKDKTRVYIKSDREKHLEKLEQLRRKTLNSYCGFDAY